jgi:acetyl esterase/lipase
MPYQRLLLVTFLVLAGSALGQSLPGADAVFPLYEGDIPGAVGTGPGHEPAIAVYRPNSEKATDIAVVVCPGGGYGGLALGHEGEDIGQWFRGEGVTAFVLTYRHAPHYQHPIPLQDAQRALRLVRSKSGEMKFSPSRVGILGFSAGGHLSATAATQFDAGQADAKDPVERLSSRPDFAVLLYPVISMTADYTHKGSRKNLLGAQAGEAEWEAMSAEKNVTKETPPTFLVASWEDKGVPEENSIAFYLALKKAGVRSEMHVYEKGAHGFGLAPKDPVLSTWPKHCIAWIQSRFSD